MFNYVFGDVIYRDQKLLGETSILARHIFLQAVSMATASKSFRFLSLEKKKKQQLDMNIELYISNECSYASKSA